MLQVLQIVSLASATGGQLVAAASAAGSELFAGILAALDPDPAGQLANGSTPGQIAGGPPWSQGLSPPIGGLVRIGATPPESAPVPNTGLNPQDAAGNATISALEVMLAEQTGLPFQASTGTVANDVATALPANGPVNPQAAGTDPDLMTSPAAMLARGGGPGTATPHGQPSAPPPVDALTGKTLPSNAEPVEQPATAPQADPVPVAEGLQAMRKSALASASGIAQPDPTAEPVDGKAASLPAKPVQAALDPAAPTGAADAAGEPTLTSISADRSAAAEPRAATSEIPRTTPAYAGQTALSQVAMRITRAVAGGADTITMQLEPADLGRVEVRLQFADGNHLRALIIADRPEALDALQRDARGLERSLQDAGLQLDDQGLDFGLRRDGQRFDPRDPDSGFESAGSDHLPTGDDVHTTADHGVARGDRLLDLNV